MRLILLGARRMLAALDWPLLILLMIMAIIGMATMHSAVGNTDWRFADQFRNFLIAFAVMWAVAMLRPGFIMRTAPYFYLFGLSLLIAVMLFGATSKGATRWLELGFIRIQPSEMMKIAVPLMLAWYFQRQASNTMRFRDFIVAGVLLVIPAALIIDQPDLGTALLVLASGFCVIYFGGLSFKLLAPVILIVVASLGTLVYYEDQICQPEVDWVVM
ncbi:MAG TPA: FtsW/RodA/SpoVE family cell cycle protein, partial [Castellaniella sp.]|nr:FtsW/RodA/SpoVE family cell cycle protein [Castellaniella sp.]